MPFGKIFGALATSIGPSLVKGLAGKMGLGSNMQDAMGGAVAPMLKVAGIPTPGSGRQLGMDAREYYKNAFPGLNPWEHAGAGNPAGQIGAVKESGRIQERMQEKQLATQEKVAEIGAEASVTSAAIAHGPDAVASIGRHRRGEPLKPYHTPSTIAKAKLKSELAKIDAEERVTSAEADLKEATAKYAELLAQYGITEAAAPNLWAALKNMSAIAAQKAQDQKRDPLTNRKRSEAWKRWRQELRRFFTGRAQPTTHSPMKFGPQPSSTPGAFKGSTHYKNQ